MADVLRKYGLEEGYLFCPTQFRTHKNHARILDDAVPFAAAMENSLDPEICAALVRAGTVCLQELERQPNESEQELVKRLMRSEARQRCWE